MAQLHGNFTPAHADGCGAQCFEGVQRASIFDLPVRYHPQAATPALRPGVDRSLDKEVPEKSQTFWGEEEQRSD